MWYDIVLYPSQIRQDTGQQISEGSTHMANGLELLTPILGYTWMVLCSTWSILSSSTRGFWTISTCGKRAPPNLKALKEIQIYSDGCSFLVVTRPRLIFSNYWYCMFRSRFRWFMSLFVWFSHNLLVDSSWFIYLLQLWVLSIQNHPIVWGFQWLFTHTHLQQPYQGSSVAPPLLPQLWSFGVCYGSG